MSEAYALKRLLKHLFGDIQVDLTKLKLADNELFRIAYISEFRSELLFHQQISRYGCSCKQTGINMPGKTITLLSSSKHSTKSSRATRGIDCAFNC